MHLINRPSKQHQREHYARLISATIASQTPLPDNDADAEAMLHERHCQIGEAVGQKATGDALRRINSALDSMPTLWSDGTWWIPQRDVRELLEDEQRNLQEPVTFHGVARITVAERPPLIMEDEDEPA